MFADNNDSTNNGGRAAGAARPLNDNEVPVVDGDQFDPTLEDDLGAEYQFRGDVVEGELAGAEDMLDEAQAVADEYKDRYVRLQAEWDNFRKRSAAEAEQQRIRANEKLVSALIPVLDDMGRALEHAGDSPDATALADGIKAVYSKFMSALESVSVVAIDPVGQPFDMNLHNAVQRVEDPSVPDETVVSVLQKGYAMGDYVVRPAMVVVSTGGPERVKE